MGVSGSGTGNGYPVINIVESIEGQIETGIGVQGIMVSQPEIIGTVSNEDGVGGTKESEETIKTTIVKRNTIKGKVNE
jgi:hypothetical protein